jgi:hypothetical protein
MGITWQTQDGGHDVRARLPVADPKADLDLHERIVKLIVDNEVADLRSSPA